MKLRMHRFKDQGRFFIFAATILGTLELAPDAHASPPYLYLLENRHQPEKVLSLAPELSYYRSTSQFDTAGGKVIPPTFSSHSRIQADAWISYGLSPEFTAYGRVSWAKIETVTSSSTEGVFGLTDQALGLNYRVWNASSHESQEGASVDLQAQVDLPGYPVEPVSFAPAHPLLGDHSLDLTFSAFLNYPLAATAAGKWWAQGGAGYTKRTKTYSSHLPWSAQILYRPRTEGFSLAGGVAGAMSMATQPANTVLVYSDYGNALGSGSKSPSLMSLRLQGGYAFSNHAELFARYTQTVWGLAVAQGSTVTIGLRFDLGRPKVIPLEEQESGFTPYTSVEAQVTKTNDRLSLVKINKGSRDGIETGQVMDVFNLKKDGSTGERIARGKVTSVKEDEAVVTISEYYKEVWIEEGFKVKRPAR